jgi:hypothetical protein
MNEEEIVRTLWSRHAQWSSVGARLKTHVVFWRAAVLVLSAVGAVLQTAAASLAPSTIASAAALGGAVALATVPFIAVKLLGAERVRGWLRARSVSEGLKSEVFRFQAGAAPYDGEDRAVKLVEAGRNLEVWVEALAVDLAGVDEGPSSPPARLDSEEYVKLRVSDQIDGYYRPRARWNASRARLFRALELTTAFLAASIGALMAALQLGAGAGGRGGEWVAVITTIGGALAAHSAANRYVEQARIFFATARRLQDVRDDWIARGRPTASGPWSEFVNACEEAISVENRAWMSKLDPEEKAA